MPTWTLVKAREAELDKTEHDIKAANKPHCHNAGNFQGNAISESGETDVGVENKSSELHNNSTAPLHVMNTTDEGDQHSKSCSDNENSRVVGSFPVRHKSENTKGTAKDGRATSCSCSKTRCLKLYCDCFQQGRVRLFVNDCNCVVFANNPHFYARGSLYYNSQSLQGLLFSVHVQKLPER